ncbi:MAG: hypothetical protein ACE5HU_06225 [Acidobacteriota bacterium]
MPQARKSIVQFLGTALLAAAFLSGCNGTNIDDGDKSDSLLVVQSVSPASVQADVSPSTDPNTLLTQPPADDTVTVTVKNVAVNPAATTPFNDILIMSFDITCTSGSLQLAGPTLGVPTSLTIPAATTDDIQILLAPGPYKEANMAALLAIGTDTCSITFHGQDLGGEPILSTQAVVALSYVDTP